jgi:hypothetical protein
MQGGNLYIMIGIGVLLIVLVVVKIIWKMR